MTAPCSYIQQLPVSQGTELLHHVLSYDTRDPLILSCVLTNLSVLLPFMHYAKSYMPAVLTKVSGRGGVEITVLRIIVSDSTFLCSFCSSSRL